MHEQVRRIVGTSIAMAYGCLPNDFFDIATRLVSSDIMAILINKPLQLLVLDDYVLCC